MNQAPVSADCRTERRKRLRTSPKVFGLDFVEVCAKSERQNNLPRFRLHFLGPKPARLQDEHILLYRAGEGQPLPVEIVEGKPAHRTAHAIEIEVKVPVCETDEHTLRVSLPADFEPTLDPLFGSLTFVFDVGSSTGGDCAAPSLPIGVKPAALDINYLAKDYATFRQLLLDRLAVTMPDWRDRSPADVGVMLVEILAYAADHLSYQQDAVATEAYLGTARLRQSLRRHARLVDYRIHEGCNARTWICVEVNEPVKIERMQDLFFVALPRTTSTAGSALSRQDLERLTAPPSRCVVFEPVASGAAHFWTGHNACRLHDWGGAKPCLAKGATSADLVHSANAATSLHLREGDVVIFEEVLGPWTGAAADADPTRRHAVRIKSLNYSVRDDLLDVSLVTIAWDEADALPFPIWISKPPDATWENPDGTDVCVVRGNVILADHGQKILDDPINLVKSHEDPPTPLAAHYPAAFVQAKLSALNLTFSDNLAPVDAPASQQLIQDKRRAVPQLILRAKSSMRQLIGEYSILELRDLARVANRLLAEFVSDDSHPVVQRLSRAARRLRQLVHTCGCKRDRAALTVMADLGSFRAAIQDDLRDLWTPRYDLIDSNSNDSHFVVEMSDDRHAYLRFGQYGFGRTPDLDEDPSLSEMHADYRVGNGTPGNIPTDAINAFGSYRSYSAAIVGVRNPLPAIGGVDPETPREIRLFAPHAVRTQLQRAVTAEDYQEIVMREFGTQLQSAKATLRWTGHEFEALISVDPRSREVADRRLLQHIRWALSRFRRIGHYVNVHGAERVVPKLKLSVCVGTNVIREQVRNELDKLFSDQVLSDGSLAFFNPDRLTFGEGIFVSQIVAAASRVPGILHVEVVELYRRGEAPADEIEDGVLPLRPLEIVRFENNRQHQEFGVLELILKGGR